MLQSLVLKQHSTLASMLRRLVSEAAFDTLDNCLYIIEKLWYGESQAAKEEALAQANKGNSFATMQWLQ